VASLIGGKRFSLKVSQTAPLKPPATYTVVGKPILRTDVPAKCTGRHVYVQDFTLPGMLHGRVIRPPAIGAKLLTVNESSTSGIPDVRVVRIESFPGVVAKDEWAAIRGTRELKATRTEWQELSVSEGLDRHMRRARRNSSARGQPRRYGGGYGGIRETIGVHLLLALPQPCFIGTFLRGR
jgi:nicotinate dehydrogenase subunit B